MTISLWCHRWINCCVFSFVEKQQPLFKLKWCFRSLFSLDMLTTMRKSLRNYIRFDQIILKLRNYTTFTAYYYPSRVGLCFKMVALHVDLADATKQIDTVSSKRLPHANFPKMHLRLNRNFFTINVNINIDSFASKCQMRTQTHIIL